MATTSTIHARSIGGPTLTPAKVLESLDQSIEIAKANGDLHMYESHVAEVVEHEIKYQVRVCPALQKKEEGRASPASVVPEPHGVSKVVDTIINHDPFLPPFTSLLIGELKDALEEDQEGYYVLLNKFAVVHGHFLLVTKIYQSQSQPLTPSQLVHTYLLLFAAQAKRQPYFAFFNCGELSGASQPHKHIQFIPGEAPIEALARGAHVENESRAFVISKLPFSAHIKRLDRSVISRMASSFENLDLDNLDRLGAELSMAFMALLDEMYHTIRVRAEHERERDAQTGTSSSGSQASSAPSYNVVMTLEHIYLFPRSAEKFIQHGGEEVPQTFELTLSINSLGYAGMLLVKSDEELEKVRQIGIGRMLGQVGMEPLRQEDDKGCDDVFADLA